MRIDPYLTFDGQAEAAFTFYQQCLGGEITAMIRFGEMPECPGGESIPASARDRVMHVSLQAGDQILMASDSFPGQPYEGIKGCMVTLSYEDNAEAERVFKALLDGGQSTMDLQETFWAERFGMLTDRYGVSWGVNGKSRMG